MEERIKALESEVQRLKRSSSITSLVLIGTNLLLALHFSLG